MPVSTLKENALEQKDLQAAAGKEQCGTFQPLNSFCLLLTVAVKEQRQQQALAAALCTPPVSRD